MKITNKETIEKILNKSNNVLGCFSDNINKLNKVNLEKIISYLESEFYCTVYVYLNRVKQVVEIDCVDNEVDINMITLKEYCEQYGHNEEDYYSDYKN